MAYLPRIRMWIGRIFLLLFCWLTLSRSTVDLHHQILEVRRFTQAREFDFISWTLDALGLKIGQSSLYASRYLTDIQQIEFVEMYFDRIQEVNRLESQLAELYANPLIDQSEVESSGLHNELAQIRDLLRMEETLAESILQEQISVVFNELGLGFSGSILPPVSFHFSRLPKALIVSPREVIRQDANIQIKPDTSLQDQEQLETLVEEQLDVSALVVSIGGIGTYPTMVMETSAVAWVIETVVHEWVHNYLIFRPLGWKYNTSSDLRTMNETVASILGREIGRRVLEEYYPSYLPPPPPTFDAPAIPNETPPFDFRAEMRDTRVEAEAMLLAGEIDQAEAYMEARRMIFWENGYRQIRKLNQAYFAFHGAYADEPGGAAGDDPVGEAVRELWGVIQDPVRFLRSVAWMDDFSDLEKELSDLTKQ